MEWDGEDLNQLKLAICFDSCGPVLANSSHIPEGIIINNKVAQSHNCAFLTRWDRIGKRGSSFVICRKSCMTSYYMKHVGHSLWDLKSVCSFVVGWYKKQASSLFSRAFLVSV